jgi:hypothetical protein
MVNHVDHLLTAYVHRQLPRAQRDRVALHVRMCAECHDALEREQQMAYDIARTLPLIGRPRRGQLARLWPTIWMEFRTPNSRTRKWLPSYSVAVVMLIACAFAISALFTGPTQAIAAPFQAAPTEILATPTLSHTEEAATPANKPQASETASVLSLPLASPAPLAGTGIVSSAKFGHGR